MRVLRCRGAWPAIIVVAGLLAACSGPGPTPSAPETSSPAASAIGLSISNGTILTVTLVVNGTVIRAFGPRSGADPIPPSQLPPLPWNVEVRTVSGRVLSSAVIHAGDVRTEGDAQQGAGARVDLSCGRLDVWSGPPMIGPMPGPGTPGDCEP